MRPTLPVPSKFRAVVLGLFAMAHVSCVKTNSSMGMISTNTANSPMDNHCGWVSVSEEETITFLGATLSVENRQFHESLFYCCPGEEGKAPVCYETRWMGR